MGTADLRVETNCNGQMLNGDVRVETAGVRLVMFPATPVNV